MRTYIAALAGIGMTALSAPAFAQTSDSAFNDMWGAEYAAAPTNWTGSYIGISTGYAGTSGAERLVFAPSDLALSTTHSTGTATIGGYMGYAYQLDSYVLGVEATAAYLGQRLGGAVPADIDWQFGLAVRAGYAPQNNTLVYLRAAWALTDVRFTNPGPLVGPAYSATDGVLSAVQLGAGVDIKLDPNWIFRFEGNYTFEGGSAVLTDADAGVQLRLTPSLYDLRAGIAYQF